MKKLRPVLAADFVTRIEQELMLPWTKDELLNGRKITVTADKAILAELRGKYALEGHEVYAVTEGTKTYLLFHAPKANK